jgi:predicted PurR-regulated permease PerM
MNDVERILALTVQTQLKYWGIAALVLTAILWALGDVILPFVLGGAIAYCLDPIADWLENRGLSRTMATVVITLFAILVFIVTFVLIIPTLAQQTVGLFEAVPQIVARFENFITTRFPDLLDPESGARRTLQGLGETIQAKGGEFAETLLSSAASLLNILILIVLVPVVTFYLLLDWDRMVGRIDELLPRDHAPIIRRLAKDIDRTLASFIRGQGTVCLIMGAYYALGLMLVGLNFGAIIGAVAGLITFIPYVGALVGGVLAIGLALFQFWGEWVWIGAVVAIFFTGQFLEGNIITPNLVGNSVGLHPVWLIFALTAFGTLFGFVGMLVAVPLAAVIGVLVRFALEEYRRGMLFKGLGEPSDGDGGQD